MPDFIRDLRTIISSRKKMTSPLYRHILSGSASRLLLQQFVVNRFPIKNFWTRNILGIASQIDDYGLRRSLVENIFEEETGVLTKSKRHLETFIDFGEALGLTRDSIENSFLLQETRDVIKHNVRVCNGGAHFTQGVASVLLLMEGQPPIVSGTGSSMLQVMRDVYQISEKGCEFFVHHASNTDNHAVSELEDEHAEAAEKILTRYCSTPALRRDAAEALATAISLRHAHFDRIFEAYGDVSGVPFRAKEAA